MQYTRQIVIGKKNMFILTATKQVFNAVWLPLSYIFVHGLRIRTCHSTYPFWNLSNLAVFIKIQMNLH